MKLNLSLSRFPSDYRREACHNREDILTEVWWFKFESYVVGVYVCVYLRAQKFVCMCVCVDQPQEPFVLLRFKKSSQVWTERCADTECLHGEGNNK